MRDKARTAYAGEGSACVQPAAGKSTLVSALAACGHQVVADDVMGLQLAGETMEGVAPGISPRLRLPLPASLPAALHEFAERYAGLEDDWYRYLDLPSGRLAAFGSTATVQAFVFLERGADSGASLHRVDRGRALQHLLHRNFARGAAAGWILERFAALVRCRECLVLRYRDVAEAAAILEAAFVTGHLERIVDEVEASLPSPGRVDASAGEAEYVASDLPLVQVPGVRLHTVGGEHFLAGRDGQAIFGLSGVGPAIWQCLAEPVTPEELAHGLADAFPDVSTARIEGDVMALLRALRARGLVRAATT